ncbi:hypothetical protein ACFL2Q_08090 [Thermodesulfobacteriota bacterium]
MTGCELFDQFFIRTVSGIFVFVLGTGAAYFLFIIPALRQIEHYKERIRVYRNLSRITADLVVTIQVFKTDSSTIDNYTDEVTKLTRQIASDKMFMSPGVNNSFQDIVNLVADIAEAPAVDIPRPPKPLAYPEEELSQLEHLLQQVLKIIRMEMQSTRFSVFSDSFKSIFR